MAASFAQGQDTTFFENYAVVSLGLDDLKSDIENIDYSNPLLDMPEISPDLQIFRDGMFNE